MTTLALAKVVAAKSLPLDRGGRFRSNVPDDAVDALYLRRDLLGDHRDELERKFDDAGLDELRRRNGADRDNVTERARSVDDADGLYIRHDREELLGLLIEFGLGHLVAEDEISLAEDVEFLLRKFAEAADSETGAGERLTHDELFGNTEKLADLAYLILVKILDGLDEAFETEILGQSADVVVGLDGLVTAYAGLGDIGENRTLAQELNLAELLGFLFENAHKLGTDDLAFEFRLDNAFRLVEEALLGVHADKIDAELALEHLLDLLTFVEAHIAVIDENAGELLADRLLEKNGADGAVDAAGHGEKHFLVADLSADRFDLFFDVFLGVEGFAYARQPFFFGFCHFFVPL